MNPNIRGEHIPAFPKPHLVVDEQIDDPEGRVIQRLRCRWDGAAKFQFPYSPEETGEYELGLENGTIVMRDSVPGGSSDDQRWRSASGKARCFACYTEGPRTSLYDLDRGGAEISE